MFSLFFFLQSWIGFPRTFELDFHSRTRCVFGLRTHTGFRTFRSTSRFAWPFFWSSDIRPRLSPYWTFCLSHLASLDAIFDDIFGHLFDDFSDSKCTDFPSKANLNSVYFRRLLGPCIYTFTFIVTSNLIRCSSFISILSRLITYLRSRSLPYLL